MEVDTAPTLLSLTEVEEIILSFMASREGGTQALLNLRMACRTTQRWIDDLPLRHRKRIFSRSQIKVDLNPENLRRYLEFPPPFPVTSLCLLNTEFLWNHTFSVRQEKLWNRFTAFWSSNLESLEVDNLCLPLPQRALGLFNCETIRSFRVNNMWLRQVEIRPLELPDFILRLEELSMNHLLITDRQKRRFYRLLSANQNLKRLEINFAEDDDLEGLTNLINTKRNDTDFHLTFRLKTGGVNLENDELYRNFVLSVAESLSTIRIIEVSEPEILGLRENFGEQFGRKLLSCVESISNLAEFTEEREFFEIADLTNLKRLNRIFIKPNNLERTRFPESLFQLEISVDVLFPPPQMFPRNLKHLNLTGFNVTASELMGSLSSLALRCPQLVSLNFHWTCAYSGLLPRDLPQPPSFDNLRSLTFKMTFYSDEDVLNCRWILLHGLCVNKLKLRTLKIFLRKNGDLGHLHVLDVATLTAFRDGPVGQTVTEVELNEWPTCEEKETALLLTKLKTIASANERNRLKTYGREQRQ